MFTSKASILALTLILTYDCVYNKSNVKSRIFEIKFKFLAGCWFNSSINYNYCRLWNRHYVAVSGRQVVPARLAPCQSATGVVPARPPVV
jgi:hypothetical protein